MKEFLELTEQSQKLHIQFQQVGTKLLLYSYSILNYLANTGDYNIVILLYYLLSMYSLEMYLFMENTAASGRDAEEHQPQQHSSGSSTGQAAAHAVPTAAGGHERRGQKAPGEEQ